MTERNHDFLLRIQSITHLYPQTQGSSGFFCVANTRPSETPGNRTLENSVRKQQQGSTQ